MIQNIRLSAGITISSKVEKHFFFGDRDDAIDSIQHGILEFKKGYLDAIAKQDFEKAVKNLIPLNACLIDYNLATRTETFEPLFVLEVADVMHHAINQVNDKDAKHEYESTYLNRMQEEILSDFDKEAEENKELENCKRKLARHEKIFDELQDRGIKEKEQYKELEDKYLELNHKHRTLEEKNEELKNEYLEVEDELMMYRTEENETNSKTE